VDRRCRQRGRLRADQFRAEGPVAEIEILRGGLSRVMVQHSGPDVAYRFGDRIAAFSQDPAGVNVTFASAVHERFDLVVGADGRQSELRGHLFPSEAQRIEHLGVYLGFWTAEKPPQPHGLDARLQRTRTASSKLWSGWPMTGARRTPSARWPLSAPRLGAGVWGVITWSTFRPVCRLWTHTRAKNGAGPNECRSCPHCGCVCGVRLGAQRC
jgi:2-polyprenyl-6-methoxyphenol hydroxylase-like FAD-dependent oxidoreductase